jgi:hypothetical protein
MYEQLQGNLAQADKKPEVSLAHNIGGIHGMIVTSVIVVGL